MINKLRWVAISRVHRAATLGFALALALVTAPAAYGADGNNPWHINIHRADSARTNTVKATAYGADGNPWHINIHRDTTGLAALTALSTAPAAATAGAGTPVSVDVTGTQTVIDEAAGTFAMHGSLVGTWYNTKFVPQYASSSQFVASGKELFVGCLDSNANGSCDKKEPTGDLKFTFMYWASFNPATGALLHGNCVHPITGGSGSFRKAAGVIFMEDTPTGDTVVTTYKGTVEYQAARSGQASRHRTLASAGTSATSHGAVCGGS